MFFCRLHRFLTFCMFFVFFELLSVISLSSHAMFKLRKIVCVSSPKAFEFSQNLIMIRNYKKLFSDVFCTSLLIYKLDLCLKPFFILLNRIVYSSQDSNTFINSAKNLNFLKM